MYEIALGELGFDVGRRELWAKRAEFLPRFRRGIFSRRLGRRTTRATLVVQEIKWRCENLFSALAEKKLVVEHFLASGVNLKMYRDKRLPRTGQRRIHRFPQSILRGLPLVVAVKEGRINRGTIEYLERDDMLTEPARLYFTDVAVLFRDLHNHPSLYPGPEETPCVVDVQARIMGKNLLSTRFILDMFDPNDSFRFEGGVSDMEGGILNPFLINASVRVAEGHVHSLRFSAAGNRFSASGTMRINYRDLKISILSKKKPGKRRGIPSFLANRVILSSNPKKNRPLRLGDMASLRRGRKPIFDLIWRSVLAGIKSSVGITKAKKR
jgi:hypothetical protein